MDTAIFEKYGLKPLEPVLETDRVTMWKMTQPSVNRTVMVHVLGPFAEDEEAASYLFSVVRTISNCAVPAIAQVYTIFNEPDLKAVVTEYVDGLTLEHTVSALGPLSVRQTVRTGLAIAEALKEIWDTSHILIGSVRPEYVTLDASSTAKLITPCNATVAPADQQVPVSDMADLGQLLYYLATGARPGEAHSVNLPTKFLAFLSKLSSTNAVERFASWSAVVAELKALESLKADAPPPKSEGKGAGKGKGKVTKIKTAEPAAAPRKITVKRADNGAARGAVARARAHLVADSSSGVGFKAFMCVMLFVLFSIVFAIRVGLVELRARLAAPDAPAETQEVAAAPSAEAAPDASGDSAPAEETAAEPDETPAETVAAEAEEPAAEETPAQALERYLEANVGSEVPFLYKGVERTVTLVRYTDTTVTIRTRKTFTLKRAELSRAQLDLWR